MKNKILTDGLNQQQRQAVEHPVGYCTKIVAGAGTGKTKIISKRFVKLVWDLISQGIENPLERILVITFTDKAANEMKGRILAELKNNGIDYAGQELQISTFHGFCMRILRSHSIEVGLSPGFRMGDEKQLQEVFDNIIKKIRYNETNTIDGLNEVSSALGLDTGILGVKSVNRLRKIAPLDIIFDDMFALIKKIKSLGIDAKEFLDKSLSATKNFSKTAQTLPFVFGTKEEYLEAWERHLTDFADDFCQFEDKDGKKGAFQALSSDKSILVKNGSRKAIEWQPAGNFEQKISKVEKIELHLTQVVALVYALYQNELEKLDMVDFDDLINKTIRIFKQNPVIRQYYRKIFKHLIIDEFQDTNGAQLELIKLLLDDNEANVTFVGDRKQSIYGFRFAQMENLEVLHSHVETKYGQKYQEIKLSTNYRSTPEVLELVNHITTNQLGLDEKLGAHRQNPDGKYVQVTVLDGFSDSHQHKIDEAKYIAEEVLRLKSQENADYKDFAILVKSHAQADFMEKQLMKSGIPAIKRVNTGFFMTPVIRNVIALLRLAKNIRDEMALIRVLEIKLSDKELYQLKIVAEREIPLDKLKRMNFCDKLIFAFENNIIPKWELSSEVKDYVGQIFDTISALGRESLSLLQTYYKLINQIKPYYLLNEIEQYRAESDLRIFEKILVDFMHGENYISIKNFLDYIDKIKDDRGFELPKLSVKDINAVQLLTVYASKGLEFPYVFVPHIKNKTGKDDMRVSFDLQYGNKPGFGIIAHKFDGKATPKAAIYKEIWKKPRAKNEALRLFYVAASRAEKYLNILSFEPYGTTKSAEYVEDLAQVVRG